MLTEITKDQETILSEVREEWLHFTLGCGTTLNPEKSKELIHFLYARVNLDPPMVVFVDSPVATQMAAHILQPSPLAGPNVSETIGIHPTQPFDGQISNHVSDKLKRHINSHFAKPLVRQIHHEVVGKVQDQIFNQDWENAPAQMKAQVKQQAWTQVSVQISEQSRDRAWVQTWIQSWMSFWDRHWIQLESKFWDQIRDRHEPEIHFLSYSQLWDSRSDLYARIGVPLPEHIQEYFTLVKASGLWGAICFKNVCIAYPAPQVIRRDRLNRLHSDRHPAIEWQDGYHQFYLRGVVFEEPAFRQITSPDFCINDLSQFKDARQKAAALCMLKPERLLEHLQAKLLDEGVKGTKLYAVPDFMNSGITQFCMTMRCPSTGRIFLEWVNPEIGRQRSADLAQASAWIDDQGNPLSLEEYLLMQEA